MCVMGVDKWKAETRSGSLMFTLLRVREQVDCGIPGDLPSVGR